MKHDIADYISKTISPDLAKRYTNFCDWIHNDNETDPSVMSSVFNSISFKKELAKKIVHAIFDGDYDSFDIIGLTRSMDARLRSLINYYWSVETLSKRRFPESSIFTIKDPDINDPEYQIVRMRPGDPLFDGYRFFIVNMLCFTANKFVLGFRADGKPIISPMKYYKGCKPLGNRMADDGTKWTLIMFDSALSDDHSAIFSNQLDGDGTIEMCDWLSDKNQRIIYRVNY